MGCLSRVFTISQKSPYIRLEKASVCAECIHTYTSSRWEQPVSAITQVKKNKKKGDKDLKGDEFFLAQYRQNGSQTLQQKD